MRGAFVVIILLVVVFFATPMVTERTTNSCQALERYQVSNTATNIAGSNTGVVHDVINSVGQTGASGQVASTDASQEHPDAPTPVTCTYNYWKDLL
jgi:hypothetical protein